MSDYIFISSDIEAYKGAEAEKKLAAKNDLPFVTDDGVVSVPEWRWQEAQLYQHYQQMVRGADRTEDRNTVHKRYFDEYLDINGIFFPRAIELGCGPFTNIRHIGCEIGELVLLDPLIEEYVEHRHNQLSGATLVSSTIEEMPDLGQFDLVVMVNVLEHCQDANLVLERVWDLVAPNGYVVFGEQSYWNVEELLGMRYDAGHPIRPTLPFLERFCQRFKPVYRRDIRRTVGYAVYFIGIRHED